MSSSQTQHERWCIVPTTTWVDESGDTRTVPVFHDKDEIDAWSGPIIPRSSLGAFYSGFLAHHPDKDEFYAVRFYATGNSGWQALNEMATTWDCLVMSEHAHNVSDVLNTRLPDEARADEVWNHSFRIERGGN